MRRTDFWIVVVALAAWLCLGGVAQAQGPAPSAPLSPSGPGAPAPGGGGRAAAGGDAAGGDATPGQSLGEILKAGGVVGMLILLLSVAAAALVIEHVMTIRAPVLMPPGLAEEVHELLERSPRRHEAPRQPYGVKIHAMGLGNRPLGLEPGLGALPAKADH